MHYIIIQTTIKISSPAAPPLQKFSLKFINSFLSYPADRYNRQTNTQMQNHNIPGGRNYPHICHTSKQLINVHTDHITNRMATIFGAEYISCRAVSTWTIVTRPLSPSVNPTNSVARRHMSSARLASPDSAATYTQNKSRLRWFGHVERKDDNDWVKHCMTWEVKGIRLRGRPKKTWWDYVKTDMESLGLSEKDMQLRNKWRRINQASS